MVKKKVKKSTLKKVAKSRNQKNKKLKFFGRKPSDKSKLSKVKKLIKLAKARFLQKKKKRR